MFEKNLEIIKNNFIEYKGTGTYFNIYLIAILYLFLKEKDKKIRALTIYFPAIVFVMIMNPLFNKLVGSILKTETYWRTFWMLPIGITIAYACVKFIAELESRNKQIAISIFLIIIIMMSGKYVFTTQNYLPVGNLYKLPDEEVHVIQLIAADDEEYKKILPSYYVVPFIRQIDSSILVAYSRSVSGYSPDSLAVLVGRGEVDKIAKKAEETNSNYIIMHKETPVIGKFEDYGYNVFEKTESYTIYKKDKNFIVDKTKE